MIIVQIIGGLGNQMFQYAAGKALADRLNTTLKLDLSGFDSYPLRTYELGSFNLNSDIASTKELAWIKYFSGYPYYLLPKPINNIINSLTRRCRFKELSPSKYDPNFEKLKGNIYLEGYWQSVLYFKKITKQIKKDFIFRHKASGKNLEYLHLIENTQSVAIHVRRGDYVNNAKTNAVHGTCSLEYYQTCLSRITKLVKDPVFFIFSDDPKWCKNNLKINYPTHYIDHNTNAGVEDMRLMITCKHQIIANSTFSWWAAWLNPNQNKLVFAPKQWFRKIRTDKQLIPEGWIQIYPSLQ